MGLKKVAKKHFAKGGVLPPGSSDHMPLFLAQGDVHYVAPPMKHKVELKKMLELLNGSLSDHQQQFVQKYAPFDVETTGFTHKALASEDRESEAWD